MSIEKHAHTINARTAMIMITWTDHNFTINFMIVSVGSLVCESRHSCEVINDRICQFFQQVNERIDINI